MAELPSEFIQKELDRYFQNHKIYQEPKRHQTLKAPYKKWFKGGNTNGSRGDSNNGKLLELLGGACPQNWHAWDSIRDLTVAVLGKRYISDITDIAEAEAVCEKICQFIYDLTCEVRNNETEAEQPE